MDDLLSAFQRLTTESERLSGLRGLVQSLNGHELNALRHLLSERTDPVHKLPIEIILDIFAYLPLVDAWRLRPVCKTWHALLSSPRFQKAAIARYETHDISDSARSPESAASDTIEHKIRHMQAVRLGRPFTIAILDDQPCAPTVHGAARRLFKVGLKGSTIAYVRNRKGGGEEVMVRNLVSGEILTVSGEGRETIQALAVTGSLAAFITFTGMMYVRNILNTAEVTTYLRLPSSSVGTLTGEGDTIATLIGGEDPSTGTVAIYSAKSGKLIAFRFSHQEIRDGNVNISLAPQDLMCNPLNDRVDVFSFDWHQVDGPYERGNLRIGVMRFSTSTDGSCGAHAVRRPISETTVTQENSPRCALGHILPVGVGKRYRLSLEVRYGGLTRGSIRREYFNNTSLLFDTAKGTLFAEDHERFAQDATKIIRWKDAFFEHTTFSNFVTSVELREHSRTRVRYQSTTDYCGISSSTSTSPWADLSDLTVLVNDSFLVGFQYAFADAARSGSVCVYCFEEDVQIPGGRSTGLWSECIDERMRAPCRIKTESPQKLPYRGERQ